RIENPHTSNDVVTLTYDNSRGYELSVSKDVTWAEVDYASFVPVIQFELYQYFLSPIAGIILEAVNSGLSSSWENISDGEASTIHYNGRVIQPAYLTEINTPYYSVEFNSTESTQLRYNLSEIYQNISRNQSGHDDEIDSCNSRFFLDEHDGNECPTNCAEELPVLEHLQLAIFEDGGSEINRSIKSYQLDDITIIDRLSGDVIQRFVLNYTTDDTERLKLLSAGDECLPLYEFGYNPLSLPGQYWPDDNLTDHWGYYNNKASSLTFPIDRTQVEDSDDCPNGTYYSTRAPDFNYAAAEVLEQVTYPDGSSTTYLYEAREYTTGTGCSSTVEEGPGLRIRQIIDDPGIGPDVVKTYTYENGTMRSNPKYYWIDYDELIWPHSSPPTANVKVYRFQSNSIVPIRTTSGNIVSYEFVTETIGDGSKGYVRTQYSQTDDETHLALVGTSRTPYLPYTDRSSQRGLPIYQEVRGGDGSLVSESSYDYDFVPVELDEIPSIAQHSSILFYTVHGNWNSSNILFYPYIYSASYTIDLRPYKLSSTTTKTYGTDGSVGEVTRSTTYQPNTGFVKEETTTNFDGTHKIEYTYPEELSGYTFLLSNDITAMPIMTKKYVGSDLAGGYRTTYFEDNFLPKEEYQILTNGVELLRGTISGYTSDGLPNDYSPMGQLTHVFTWENGLLKEIRYENSDWQKSFEYYPGGRSARLLRSASEIDGQSTSYQYDDCRRLEFVFARGGAITTRYGYGIGIPNTVTTTTTFGDGTPAQTNEQAYDGLGRLLHNVKNGLILVQNFYNSYGEIYAYEDPISRTEIQYEPSPLKRVLSETYVDGNTNQFEYFFEGSKSGMRRTNEKGLTNSMVQDAFGRLTRTVNQGEDGVEGDPTRYRYDIAGNLNRIIPPIGAPYVFTYDERNRLTYKSVPDGEELNLCYTDASDRLCNVTDANGNTFHYQYDHFGRITSVYWTLGGSCSSSSASETCGGALPGNAKLLISNTYDAPNSPGYKGRLTSRRVAMLEMDGYYVNSQYQYDGYGRLNIIDETADLDNASYQDRYNITYNDADWTKSILRNGNTINSTYQASHNSFGNPIYESTSLNIPGVSGKSLVTSMAYNGAQQRTVKRFGGVSSYLDLQAYGYTERGWLRSINGVNNELIQAYDICGEPYGDPDLTYTSEEEVDLYELLELIVNGFEVEIDGLDPCGETCDVADYTVDIPLWDNDIPYFPCTLRYQTGVVVDDIATSIGAFPLDHLILYYAEDAILSDHQNENYDLFGPNFNQDGAIVELRTRILQWFEDNDEYVQNVVLSLQTDNAGQPAAIRYY
ncbi:MAG: hypothetical protein AAFN81_27270, partial [Bacteroidota bacterium]